MEHKLSQYGLVPVVKIETLDHSDPLASALVEGGLPVAEITLRTQDALQSIATLARRGDILIGAGTVLNCPQAPGSGDREWLGDFESQVLPAVEAFAPDLVLVSAGFDAHHLDPLSDTLVDTAAYRRMTEGLLEVAGRCCGGRLVSLLEGGYSLEGLAQSASAHVGALLTGP